MSTSLIDSYYYTKAYYDKRLLEEMQEASDGTRSPSSRRKDTAQKQSGDTATISAAAQLLSASGNTVETDAAEMTGDKATYQEMARNLETGIELADAAETLFAMMARYTEESLESAERTAKKSAKEAQRLDKASRERAEKKASQEEAQQTGISTTDVHTTAFAEAVEAGLETEGSTTDQAHAAKSGATTYGRNSGSGSSGRFTVNV